jgi:ectoine hydroxylase-related dioxygenase (phytanoyl-CoA dioxygenase family)
VILTNEEINRYRRDGYLSLDRPVLGGEEIAAARAKIDQLFDDWQSYPNGRLTGNIRLGGDLPGVSGIMGAAVLDRQLARLPMMKTCRQIASELLSDRRTWFHFDHVVSKDSGDDTQVDWHQDYAYSSTGLTRRSVHFWVPLQSITAAHGSMVYLPGSHREGMRDHQSMIRTGESILTATVEDEGVELAPIEVGGLVCHDPMTLHYSMSNNSGEVRRAWVLHFGAGPWPALRQVSGPILSRVAGIRCRMIRGRSGCSTQMH